MSDLSGKTLVVTGGNSAIGYATARKLKELGAAVMITGRNPQAVDQAALVRWPNRKSSTDCN